MKLTGHFGSVLISIFLFSGCIENAPSSVDTADELADSGRLDSAVSDAGTDVSGEDEPAGPDASFAPPGCGNEDDLAPNQSPDTASEIDDSFTNDELFLCANTEDWYVLQFAEGQVVTIRLIADPEETDLNLAVLDENGGIVADESSPSGREVIEFSAPANGDYFLRVSGADDQAGFYQLSISSACRLDSQCPEGQLCDRQAGECIPTPESDCGLDDQEPNDTDATATPIDGALAVVEGVLCGADRDWFEFVAQDGDSYTILVSFDEGQDVDVRALDGETGQLVDSATSDARTNPERLSFSHLPAGRYIVGLNLFVPEGERDREASFRLELVGMSGACETDRDCVAEGYPVCDSGTCQPPTPGAGLGERCAVDEDCDDAAEFCFTGFDGGHDNFCSRRCRGNGDCAGFDEGATCVPIQRNTAICYPGCRSDDDCGVFYTCRENRCDLRGRCRTNEDCDDGEQCRASRQGDFYCALPDDAPMCGADEGNDPNNERDDATRLAFGERTEGLNICNPDNDWYRVVVPEDRGGAVLRVEVAFRAGVDIDVYVFDVDGNKVGESTTPDQTEEAAEIRFIAPGPYFIRVDQFDSDRLEDTTYSIQADIFDNEEGCTPGGNECDQTQPLRSVCDVETGGCRALEGEGRIGLGERCDSNDDCDEEADVCFSFRGGGPQSICTVGCRRDNDCRDMPNTECVRFNRGPGVCLPED